MKTFFRRIFGKKPVIMRAVVMICHHCEQKVLPGALHTCSSGIPGSSFNAPTCASEDTSNFFLLPISGDAGDPNFVRYIVNGKLLSDRQLAAVKLPYTTDRDFT